MTKCDIRTGFERDISVEMLIAVLDGRVEPYGIRAVLNRTFEQYGNFIHQPDELGKKLDLTRFWGNFENVSYGFQVDTDDPDLIERLTKAIRDNQALPEYLAQPSGEERRAKRAAVQRDAIESHLREAEAQAANAEREAARLRLALYGFS